ncbi:MAG TPA: TMEM175 family protein [Solirubrobacterales bacterium]|nr:TMEM175 family protein [Solirubrobacterales bacterium]
MRYKEAGMRKLAESESDGLTTGRVEGFSDGVLAIAITLLVLQLGEGEGEGSLAHRLGQEWPFFLSYFVSFVNIGTVWLNHHKVVSRLGRIDHTFLVLNLLLLMIASVLPFPTRMVGEELASGSAADQQTAALLYAGTFLFASVAFYLLWR